MENSWVGHELKTASSLLNTIIQDEKGLDIKVCQKAFCGVHAFRPKRLCVVREKITDAMNGSTVVWDERGKYHGHMKVSEAVQYESIYDHTLRKVATTFALTTLGVYISHLIFPLHGCIEISWRSMILSIFDLKKIISRELFSTNQLSHYENQFVHYISTMTSS